MLPAGSRLTLDGVRERVGAHRDALDESTEIGIHAYESLTPSVANRETSTRVTPSSTAITLSALTGQVRRVPSASSWGCGHDGGLKSGYFSGRL